MIIRSALSISPFVLVEHAGFRYLAVIQNEMQIGALALTPEGQYVQVNGAVVQPLNRYKVQRALGRDQPGPLRRRNPSRSPPRTPTKTATPPVVSVRRRRRVPAEVPHG